MRRAVPIAKASLLIQLPPLAHHRLDVRQPPNCLAVVMIDRKHPTGVSFILVDEFGDKQVSAMPASSYLAPEDARHASVAMSAAKIVILDCVAPLDTIIATVEMAHQSGAKIIVALAEEEPLGEPPERDDSDELDEALTPGPEREEDNVRLPFLSGPRKGSRSGPTRWRSAALQLLIVIC